MMNRILMMAAMGGVLALLSGCATMSEDQCRAGDWGGKGYQDGLNGRQEERLEDHFKACGKYGITPNPQAYFSAREQGLRTYCRWDNGFRVGRSGGSYYGVCTPAEERDFLPAYQDGLSREERERIRERIREVRGELRNAHHALREAEYELRSIEYEARLVIRTVGSRYGVW